MTDEEFWSLTPRMYDKLLRHKIELGKEEDYRASLTPWILTNVYRDRERQPQPISLLDYLSSMFSRFRKVKKPQKTEDQIKAARLTDAVMNRKKDARDR